MLSGFQIWGRVGPTWPRFRFVDKQYQPPAAPETWANVAALCGNRCRFEIQLLAKAINGQFNAVLEQLEAYQDAALTGGKGCLGRLLPNFR